MSKASKGLTASQLLTIKTEILESIAQDESLDVVLKRICQQVKSLLKATRVILLRTEQNSQNLSVLSALGLPETLSTWLTDAPQLQAWRARLDGSINIISNIRDDADWQDSRAIATRYNCRACWSFPVVVKNGLLGYLVVFFDDHCKPGKKQHDLLTILAHLSGLAVDSAEHEELLGHYRLAVENSSQGILVADSEGKIFRCNRAWLQNSGWIEQEILGEDLIQLLTDEQEVADTLSKSLLKHKGWRGEIDCRRKDGEKFAALCSINCVLDKQQKIYQYVAEVSDISIVKASQQRLKYLAHHDSLTDLPNRVAFTQNLDHRLQRQVRDKKPLAVLFVDLDEFKRVNDQEGHAVGDQLLKQAARRLQNCVRDTDIVARLGGDEFTLMVSYSDVASVEMLAERIITELTKPFSLGGMECHISATIGIALAPEDSNDSARLIQNADAAMYQAKGLGKQRYCFFSNEINDAIQTRKKMEVAVRHAIRRGELDLAYQPKFDRDSKVVGIEALLRWNNSKFNGVGVEDFIRTAERIHVIDDVGKWVLTQGCQQIKEWQDKGHKVKLSFNISRYQLQNDLQSLIEGIIEEAGITPQNLELEINESTLLEEIENCERLLSNISKMGVTVSLDDFGAGYSSLSNFRHLPITKLKVDQSLIARMTGEEANCSIVSAAIALGRALNLTVAAEGVETREQHDLLLANGCDEFQGFLLGMPVTSEELSKLLH